MSASECYAEGSITCLHCHSMHDSDPNDQLSRQALGNESCLQCHGEFRERVAEHTHHVPNSSGSQCYNCHMPHTNYALFKSIRSHRIDIPRVVSIASNSRPNACNLCHLDQTLQWTADRLEQWYGRQSAELQDDEKQTSAAILWALRGDAGQRVIAAWHLGWAPAREASGAGWSPPILWGAKIGVFPPSPQVPGKKD